MHIPHKCVSVGYEGWCLSVHLYQRLMGNFAKELGGESQWSLACLCCTRWSGVIAVGAPDRNMKR